MGVLLGTSGWQYKSWKDGLYAEEPQRRWLERYAESFQTVEVNNAFYRLPERTTFEEWARRTPDDFIIGVKMSRYLTHIKRLREPAEPVDRFLDRTAGLGGKLGPVLLQLPPNLQSDPGALDAVLRRFPENIRVAVECRHESWFTAETRAVLERHNAALSWADSPHRETPVWRTAAWGYLRFHQGTGRPKPCYRPSALREWAERLTSTFTPHDDVFVFFNNDPNGCAPRDAARFGESITNLGGICSRHPLPKRLSVGHEAFTGSIG